MPIRGHNCMLEKGVGVQALLSASKRESHNNPFAGEGVSGDNLTG